MYFLTIIKSSNETSNLTRCEKLSICTTWRANTTSLHLTHQHVLSYWLQSIKNLTDSLLCNKIYTDCLCHNIYTFSLTSCLLPLHLSTFALSATCLLMCATLFMFEFDCVTWQGFFLSSFYGKSYINDLGQCWISD